MAIKAARQMPYRQLWFLILNAYQEKLDADRNAARDGLPYTSMPDFLTNFMLFKYGTRKLVTVKLASVIATLRKRYKTDPVARLFSRFVSCWRPLPLDCLLTMLETLDLAWSGGGFAQAVFNTTKDANIFVTGFHSLQALRVMHERVPFMNLWMARADLM